MLPKIFIVDGYRNYIHSMDCVSLIGNYITASILVDKVKKYIGTIFFNIKIADKSYCRRLWASLPYRLKIFTRYYNFWFFFSNFLFVKDNLAFSQWYFSTCWESSMLSSQLYCHCFTFSISPSWYLWTFFI